MSSRSSAEGPRRRIPAMTHQHQLLPLVHSHSCQGELETGGRERTLCASSALLSPYFSGHSSTDLPRHPPIEGVQEWHKQTLASPHSGPSASPFPPPIGPEVSVYRKQVGWGVSGVLGSSPGCGRYAPCFFLVRIKVVSPTISIWLLKAWSWAWLSRGKGSTVWRVLG